MTKYSKEVTFYRSIHSFKTIKNTLVNDTFIQMRKNVTHVDKTTFFE